MRVERVAEGPHGRSILSARPSSMLEDTLCNGVGEDEDEDEDGDGDGDVDEDGDGGGDGAGDGDGYGAGVRLMCEK